LILGTLALSSITLKNQPKWLLITNIVLGIIFLAYPLYALFLVPETQPVLFPAFVSVIPLIGYLLAILANKGIEFKKISLEKKSKLKNEPLNTPQISRSVNPAIPVQQNNILPSPVPDVSRIPQVSQATLVRPAPETFAPPVQSVQPSAQVEPAKPNNGKMVLPDFF